MATRLQFATVLTVLVIGAMISPPCFASDSLKTTIRANSCIANSTHCHCGVVDAKVGSVCLKPIAKPPGKCKKGNCAAGYRCDCESNSICAKKSTTSYKTTDTSDKTTVDCTSSEVLVPKGITGTTTDFHIVASQEFQLFVNNREIGYGESNVYKVLTAEICSGDVIATVARRMSSDAYGIKLRFQDVQQEMRVIDENWYASSTFVAGWLDKSFDPVGNAWKHPSIATTITEDNFDKNVPWMWYGTADTVYMRYIIP